MRCSAGRVTPYLEILGNPHARRLSIVSFRIRHGAHYLHHNFVVALLNDLFGIQARGGCSCAGAYGHRLLAIDRAHSDAYRDEVVHGCDGIKPGWVRINFNYFITDTVRDYGTSIGLIRSKRGRGDDRVEDRRQVDPEATRPQGPTTRPDPHRSMSGPGSRSR